ncbi:hypothetical protein [Qipengyuania atrilutea]|uniref:Uncharacterized protein n=1 Tax=Qipengyuania atrilutea TaxID=2744473 RepID=A0A850H5H0_9SPHN|nr:hypothetical protein [Actirhodobacter atriluteus]NVD44375.1 hypothetical protein [Actirhodobacter atriluteus]
MEVTLSVLQVFPAVAYLCLAYTCRKAFVRSWNREPRAFDLIEAPIFFTSLSIAYNILWVVCAGSFEPPANNLEAFGRLLGMGFHLACCYLLIRGVKDLRGYGR